MEFLKFAQLFFAGGGVVSPGVMDNVLDCSLEVNEFELQLRYYFHFRTNTLRKDMNLLTLLSRG